MSAKRYNLQREVELHSLNIKLLRQRSLDDALEYALDAGAHYEGEDAGVSEAFFATAREIQRELYPDAFKPEVVIPAAVVVAEKSELPVFAVW